MAPPSTVNGKAYKVLNATAPAMPPSWLVEKIRAKAEPQVQKSVTTVTLATESQSQPDEAKLRDALKFIAADNYDDWLKVGMALHGWNATAGLCL